MVFPDGAKYEGAFADDNMQGEGVYTYPNGDVYSGMFAGGKKSGSGSYFFKASASTFMGEWEGGEFKTGSGSSRAAPPTRATSRRASRLVRERTPGPNGFRADGYLEDGQRVRGWAHRCRRRLDEKLQDSLLSSSVTPLPFWFFFLLS